MHDRMEEDAIVIEQKSISFFIVKVGFDCCF